ncbi:MAG: ABC transporter ATP-binding protein [candidate division KSB1 bacterium]|nr:ABC transporter ATP-binding protein [candidate division KSB1 bacterium]MDQ7064979.1 ABC transporter ATP-binding protein [candidate division KSB1 bacterium]
MIEIIDLHKSFNGNPVLRGVDLQIHKGEAHVIIGRSGCGKSVLLKHIIGLLRPDKGDVVVDGIALSRLKRRDMYRVRKKIGMLFQNSALFDSMTVEDNIALGVREHRMFPDAEVRRRVAELLEMVGLPGIQRMFPSELSGGMRKRVALARALMMEPEYVLYDEPTTGLDPIMADSINELMIRINEAMGVTSVVVTHDMASAYKVGDKMSMLEEGKVIFTGTPEEIQASDNPIIQQFIRGSQSPDLSESVLQKAR